ncbi:MAG: hypothetical protein K6T55_03745 [Syntrophobacterales bacterium]|nr:hypothetical protein [Syntrophobacterales bacterium]
MHRALLIHKALHRSLNRPGRSQKSRRQQRQQAERLQEHAAGCHPFREINSGKRK